MSYSIVAVGGTGQMVLHYLLQLYLLGEIDHPFDAVLIDTDSANGSVVTMEHFLGLLQYGAQPQDALGERIPSVKFAKVDPGAFDNAAHKLTGTAGDLGKGNLHPCQAYFSNEMLGQNLMQGLFARPALSSLISRESISDELLRPEANSTVVIVGSVIGGTGGGLISPIADTIWNLKVLGNVDPLKLRAVLFGEFFKPDQQNIDGGFDRMKSNQTLVLRSIEEALSNVHSYCVVGGPGVYDSLARDPAGEKAGRNISWPGTEQHPFWLGAMSVEYLLTDTVTDRRAAFSDRQTDFKTPPVNLDRAHASLRQKVQLVDELVSKKALGRICNDFLATMVWGADLTSLITHYWELAAQKAGGKARVTNFPSLVETELWAIWNGSGAQQPGLREVFPALDGLRHVRPGDVARVSWPRASSSQRSPQLFTSAEVVARKLAATIIFWTLRRGR
ncbi:MAG: hypothetical protein ABI882_24240 [Acidobacteriota bacterium]